MEQMFSTHNKERKRESERENMQKQENRKTLKE